MLDTDQRVLFLAPTKKDATAGTRADGRGQAAVPPVRSLDELCREIPKGVGAVVVPEEAAAGDGRWRSKWRSATSRRGRTCPCSCSPPPGRRPVTGSRPCSNSATSRCSSALRGGRVPQRRAGRPPGPPPAVPGAGLRRRAGPAGGGCSGTPTGGRTSSWRCSPTNSATLAPIRNGAADPDGMPEVDSGESADARR